MRKTFALICLAVTTAAMARPHGWDEPITAGPHEQIFEVCRNAVAAKLQTGDTGVLDRFMEASGLTAEQRADLYLICAGYAQGVNDQRRGRVH